MKVNTHHRNTLAQRVAPFDTEGARSVYRNGDFSRSEHVVDLDKRYRWDLFWASGGGAWIQTLPYDVTDAHIDTVLRRIVPSLFGKKKART